MKPSQADNYNAAFPKRVPLSEAGGIIGGTWMIGSCYKNPNGLYGAYPHGYLDRVHAMFPGARNILHVFSGGLTVDMAVSAAWPPARWVENFNHEDITATPGYDMELVDLGGEGRHPTTECSVEELPLDWDEKFDLVLADPPYSKDDAAIYGPEMYNCRRVMSELHRVTKVGGTLVWLDQKWPMHKKTMWKTFATIGLVRSTNHRMRLVSMFDRQP